MNRKNTTGAFKAMIAVGSLILGIGAGSGALAYALGIPTSLAIAFYTPAALYVAITGYKWGSSPK